MDSKAAISWFTPPVGEGVGYGYAAIETIKALQRKEIAVWWKSYEPKVQISFVQPDFYEGIPDQYRIGYTPWESTEIPEHWINKMQDRDEIWTTSTFCKEIFDSYEVNKIVRVVPHGIDHNIWKIHNRYTTDRFIFLHVGGPTGRKGGQKVVDAFLDLFDGQDDKILVLKVNEETEARVKYKGVFGNAELHPQIHVIRQSLSTDDLVKLYNSANCLVYPTNGEGFGLIPFQGIASGLPTICTDATACADYANLSVPLKSFPAPGNGIHIGNWVNPDLDDLREKMSYVVDNYESVVDKTLQGARIIHATQTWDNIADKIVDILGDKIYERV